MATQLSYGQADLYLTARQQVALEAAAHQMGHRQVGQLFQDVIWHLANALLADAGVTDGDSGPTVYDKVQTLLVKEEAERGL